MVAAQGGATGGDGPMKFAATKFAAALALPLAAFAPAPAHGTQVCAWLIESNAENDVRNLELWLQADAAISFTYQIGGLGLVDESGHANAPNSGIYELATGTASSPWKIGATFLAPGRIDVTVVLHARTPSIFDPPGPVISSFTFARTVPENETEPPKTLAARQCASVPPTS